MTEGKSRWYPGLKRESGEVAVALVLGFIVAGILLAYWGFSLVALGASGQWEITKPFQAIWGGFLAYVLNLLPGFSFVWAAVKVVKEGPAKALWALQEGYKSTSDDNVEIAQDVPGGRQMTEENSRWYPGLKRESGEVAVALVWGFIVAAIFLAYWGFNLVVLGAKGEWEITKPFEAVCGGFVWVYILNLAPGFSFVWAAVEVVRKGPAKALWALQEGYKTTTED